MTNNTPLSFCVQDHLYCIVFILSSASSKFCCSPMIPSVYNMVLVPRFPCATVPLVAVVLRRMTCSNLQDSWDYTALVCEQWVTCFDNLMYYYQSSALQLWKFYLIIYRTILPGIMSTKMLTGIDFMGIILGLVYFTGSTGYKQC